MRTSESGTVNHRLAFKGWTFRSPTSYDNPDGEEVPYVEPSASTRYIPSHDVERHPTERGYASEGDSLALARRVDAMVDEVVIEDDDDADSEPYPRPYHENRRYPTYGRYYADLPPRPRVKSNPMPIEYESGYGTDASHDELGAVSPGVLGGFGGAVGKYALSRSRTYSGSSFDPAREFDPDYDRGAELVRWQEIVADSAAAEAALAAAAAAAAQHKRISEVDGSDTPSEDTPRASEATVRAHRRLKMLRARVSMGRVVVVA